MIPAGRTQPWRPGDTPAVLTLNVLAAVGVVVCWVGSATEIRFHDSLYWLQGAIVAGIAVVVGLLLYRAVVLGAHESAADAAAGSARRRGRSV